VTNWTNRTIEELGRLPGTWDVLPAGAAPPSVCGNYETAEAAYAAIRAAGLAPIREGVEVPALDPEHDPMSRMRFGRNGGALAVIIVRRRHMIASSKEHGMTGRILLVTKLKGGAGATTTVRELAVAAAVDKLRVALIDLDAQGGITRWWNRRNPAGEQSELSEAPNPSLLEIPVGDVPGKAQALRRAYNLVLIDSPPTVHEAIRAVGAIADLAVIPTRPTTDDLDAVGPIARLLRGAVDVGFVLTQVPPGGRSRDAAEAHALLARLAPVFGSLSFRLDYPRAAAAGSTGFEAGGTATKEIIALWQTLADRLDIAAWQHNGTTSSRDDGTTRGSEK